MGLTLIILYYTAALSSVGVANAIIRHWVSVFKITIHVSYVEDPQRANPGAEQDYRNLDLFLYKVTLPLYVDIAASVKRHAALRLCGCTPSSQFALDIKRQEILSRSIHTAA